MTSEIARRRSSALDDGTPGYRERRQHIINAAARVFKRKGYRATSLSDIAREAETDRATIYYYVSGKAELFDEVVSSAVEANAALAKEVRAGSQEAPAKLRQVIESLMASYANNFPYLYVFVQENPSHVEPERAEWSRRMRQLNHRYEDALVGIIRDGIEEGTLSPTGDPRVVACGVRPTWHARVDEQLVQSQRVSPEHGRDRVGLRRYLPAGGHPAGSDRPLSGRTSSCR